MKPIKKIKIKHAIYQIINKAHKLTKKLKRKRKKKLDEIVEEK